MKIKRIGTLVLTLLFIFMNVTMTFAATGEENNSLKDENTQIVSSDGESQGGSEIEEQKGNVESQDQGQVGDANAVAVKGKGNGNGGGSGGGQGGHNGGGQGGSGSEQGTISLVVTIKGLGADKLPINVTLTRDGVDQVVQTVTGEGGVATASFTSEASGDCSIKGQDVPGYVTPVQQVRLTGDVKNVTAELVYVAATTNVESITLNKTELSLIKGYSEQLQATVKPANANNQNVIWESSKPEVAVVNNGKVEALSSGEAVITVKSAENNQITATCNVNVVSIVSLVNPADVIARLDQTVILPRVVNATLDNESVVELSVVWETQEGDKLEDYTFKVPVPSEGTPGNPSFYELLGKVQGAAQPATLKILVDNAEAVHVVGVELSEIQKALVINGDPEDASFTLTVKVWPENATVKDVVWASDNNAIATVANGVVTAHAPGYAIISAKTVDGGKEVFCLVAVSTAIEPSPIIMVEEGGSIAISEFEYAEDVYVNVDNLAQTGTYYIKIEQRGQGNKKIIGQGQVIISEGMEPFNLYKNVKSASSNFTKEGFDIPTTYSKMCFVTMSTNPSFPMGDEQSVMANFKVGGATPTIPKENIVVTSNVTGGPLDGKKEGILFLLCRELDEPTIDKVTWKDYLLDKVNVPANPYALETEAFLKLFGDEVKVKGITDSNGNVVWYDPKETIKLGGYVLLEVTPNGYKDNLNYYNPESEDSEMLKEIRLERDGSIERHVTNVYLGGETEVSLNETGLSLYPGETYQLKTTVPVFSQPVWTSSDTSVATVEKGLVTAVAKGTAVISAKIGELTLYCIVSVAIEPEPALIFPTILGGTDPVSEFVKREDVFINMVRLNPTVGTKYYVKVEERGMGGNIVLGEGSFLITEGFTAFNLYDVTKFNPASSYSSRYFVSLSKDPAFPRGDGEEDGVDPTLTTNFSIGTAAPTIDTSKIIVNTKFFGGPLESPEGTIVLLCRELDNTDLEDHTWQLYYLGDLNSNGKVDLNEFSDEVKLIGIANASGDVIWRPELDEPIKLGGYVLLQVTPEGYADNTNLVNPFSEDGSLLRAVTLKRDGGMERQIISVYAGMSHGPSDHSNVSVSVNEGSYDSAQTISFSSIERGAAVYYTLDGSDPTSETGIEYESPFIIDKDTTLKYIIVYSDGHCSQRYALNYQIRNQNGNDGDDEDTDDGDDDVITDPGDNGGGDGGVITDPSDNDGDDGVITNPSDNENNGDEDNTDTTGNTSNGTKLPKTGSIISFSELLALALLLMSTGLFCVYKSKVRK